MAKNRGRRPLIGGAIQQPPERPRRPEFMMFEGECGPEMLVVAHVAHIQVIPLDRHGRFTLAFMAAGGAAQIGDFSAKQADIFRNEILRMMHGTPKDGLGVWIDKLAQMVKDNYPESPIVTPDGPHIVTPDGFPALADQA